MLATLAGTDLLGYRVRALVVGDLHNVLRIERTGGSEPWTTEDVRTLMGRPDAAGLVAETASGVVAFAIYSFDDATCVVRKLTVAPEARRGGAGSALLAELRRLAGGTDRLISVELPESALEAQLFLRRCGFVCERVFRSPEDGVAYRFVWTAYRALIAPTLG